MSMMYRFVSTILAASSRKAVREVELLIWQTRVSRNVKTRRSTNFTYRFDSLKVGQHPDSVNEATHQAQRFKPV